MQARGARVAVLVAVLVATLVAAIGWATWEGLRADRGKAPAVSIHGPDPARGRIALGLLLAMAAGLAGAVLIRWVRPSAQRAAQRSGAE